MARLFVPFLLQELVVILTTLMSNLILNLWHCESYVTEGIAYAFQVFFLFNIITASICYVANLFISQHYGRGDIEGVQKDYYVLLKIVFTIGLIFFILVLAIPEQLLFFANSSARGYAAQYLRWFSPVFLCVAPAMINYTLMKNMHLEKFCTLSSIITFVLVFTLESSLIFTLGTAHESWALEIAASSMVIARICEVIFLFIIINKKCLVKFKIKDFIKPDHKRFTEVAKYGLPVFFGKVSWGLGFIFITVFTSMYLEESVRIGHSLMINYENIVMCLSNATASVCAILIGRELGANRLRKAKDHASDISRLLFIMGIIEASVFMLFLPIAIATTAPETLQKVGDYLWKIFLIQAFIFIPRSYNASYTNGLFNAGGDTVYIMIIDGITAWITIVPLAFIGLNYKWDPLVIYALIQFEEVFKCPVNVIRYKQMKWVKNITHKKGIVFNE